MATSSSATRKILWGVGGLLIVVVILGVVGRVTGMFGGRSQAISAETSDASFRTITQVVTASGKIQPETDVMISPDVSGEVIQLTVREGDYVEKGVLLARIKPDFYVTQVEQAQAGVLQAKASQAQRKADMMSAQSELRRQEDLFAKSAISEREVEQARSQFEVSKAAFEGAEYAVQSAEARLREAQEQVSKTAIYSPMSGTISKLDIELGERVVGTSQMAGTEMMRIARLNQMEVEVEVNENEIVHVVLGDTAGIEVDAYPERPFHGIVTEIANSARTAGAGTQEQVTSFPVKVRITDAHNLDSVPADRVSQNRSVQPEEVPLPIDGAAQFRPGMSATVDIYTETVWDVVAVPIQAVTVRDFNKVSKDSTVSGEDGAQEADSVAGTAVQPAGADEEDIRKVVFIVEDGKARMIEVETGISDDAYVEIRSGLNGDEKVIIGPFQAVSRTLEPGDDVESENQGGERPPFVAARE